MSTASAIEVLTHGAQSNEGALFEQTIRTPESNKGRKVPFKNASNFTQQSGTKVKETKKWGCACMDKSFDQVKVIDHLQKRNCQECGAFLLGNEDDETSSSTKSKVPIKVRVSMILHSFLPLRLSSKKKTSTLQTCHQVNYIVIFVWKSPRTDTSKAKANLFLYQPVFLRYFCKVSCSPIDQKKLS